MKRVFRAIRSLFRFLRNYKQLTLVLGLVELSVILDLSNHDVIAHWILAIAALGSAIPIAIDMIEDLRSGKYGIDILALTAIISSVLLHEFWAGIVIVIMLTGGEALEDYAEQRAKVELSALLARRPTKAHLLRGRKVIDVTVEHIAPGDKLVIRPGEVVPVDAVVLEGVSSFDESSLTGESLPVEKAVGDELLSGSVNMEGAITVRALRAESESQYEQIIKLVKAAASSQSPFVRLADRYSIPFTLFSFTLAILAWVMSGHAIRFLEVIVVATPCPLLLGAPIALISGMSRSAKHGIIIKSGSALERMAEVQTLAFDKTGTLTEGQPRVEQVKVFGKHKQGDVLALAASLEQQSNHILAKAIVEAALVKKLKIPRSKNLKEFAGFGLRGVVQGKDLVVGKLGLLKDQGIPLPAGIGRQDKQTTTYVAINGELAGTITIGDTIRSEANKTIARLKKAGVKHLLMITGDNARAANAVAKRLVIDEVIADALPADKLLAIEHIKHRPVAFVGDGVNDAPVLTAADVGIALGARGSTAASESADAVILLDDLSHVASAIEIAKRTFHIAKQSILIGICLSLGLMLIFSTGRFKPVYGAAIQEVVDVTVILNALRAHGSWRTTKKSAH